MATGLSNDKIEAAGKNYIRYLTAVRKCAQCGKQFMMANSIGQYGCMRHTGYWRSGNSVWSCCRADLEQAAGCVHSDHSDMTHFFVPSMIAVPRQFFAMRVVSAPSDRAAVFQPTAATVSPLLTMLDYFQMSGLTLQEKKMVADTSVVISTVLASK